MQEYRNTGIIELIKQSKQTYDQHHFEENKKDSKTISQGIHEIISSTKNKKGGNASAITADDNTIIDPIKIAESFNNLFTSIGANLQKKIPPTMEPFTDYLEKPNFIKAPATPEEICDLIHILNQARALVLIVFPLKS